MQEQFAALQGGQRLDMPNLSFYTLSMAAQGDTYL